MRNVAVTAVEDGIGLLTIDSPPVNALGIAVRRGLVDCMDTLTTDPGVSAIVIICSGRTFFAGADITEFGRPLLPPTLAVLFDMIEKSRKPVIAAIHGTALGGGLELALVCHHRVAVPSAKLGLPEVNLGLLPGAGGTQRLPRIVGVSAALDLITSGRAITTTEALQMGIIDLITTEDDLRNDAIAFARDIVRAKKPLLRVRDRNDLTDAARDRPDIFGEFRARNAARFRGFKAPENIIRAIEAAVELPFEQGLIREQELFQELHHSRESAAQRHIFFAERESFKVVDMPANTSALSVRSVGIVGAGTMGGGIAMNFLNIGIPVTLAERDQMALDKGIAVIGSNYQAMVRKGRLTQQDMDRRMSLITQSVKLKALAGCDLLIEAVFESMQIKKDIFRQLDRIAPEPAILASNTSFLNLDEIAGVAVNPGRVIGLHFFSPANVMRLLEVVRGDATSPSTIAAAMKLARQIGKVAVVSRVCDGFIANRLMMPRMHEAEALVLEGPTPAEIDQVIRDYGFPMGPFQMIDLVGLDVIGRDANTRSLSGDLVARGRYGQKKNGGYYDYDERRLPSPSAVAAEVIAAFARQKGVAQKLTPSADSILARIIYPVVNEGAKILAEGIAQRASDIDVAAVLGYGWPVHTGGPMFWADTVGLSKIVAELRRLAEEYGPRFTPAPLLVERAANGGKLVA